MYRDDDNLRVVDYVPPDPDTLPSARRSREIQRIARVGLGILLAIVVGVVILASLARSVEGERRATGRAAVPRAGGHAPKK